MSVERNHRSYCVGTTQSKSLVVVRLNENQTSNLNPDVLKIPAEWDRLNLAACTPP